MTTSGMMAAVAAAAGITEEKLPEFVLSVTTLKASFPALAAELKAEGADAERARILGIEAAALPGHDKIVAAHKADPAKSPADCAMAIIAAERDTRGRYLAGLDADEAALKGLRSEPANGHIEPARQPGAGLEGEPKWKAEWDASARLQGEFRTQAEYLALMKAEASGQIRRFIKRSA